MYTDLLETNPVTTSIPTQIDLDLRYYSSDRAPKDKTVLIELSYRRSKASCVGLDVVTGEVSSRSV
ncbi:hypothetical protein Bca52824_076841 [Brassica carinata]|uniref:Uncharacterized protein n=1 Tax=Brassica carinata TaxID=52824 RepID=A0A8X7PVN3_BRACI|nr:hypothetical protein Bca52824_076841 [Brassica carinata]